MYDLIGDIHGHADELVELLEALGYQKAQGVYRHPERKVIFLGDFIDRGPKIRQVLEIVRPMIEEGKALARFLQREGEPSPIKVDPPNRNHLGIVIKKRLRQRYLKIPILDRNRRGHFAVPSENANIHPEGTFLVQNRVFVTALPQAYRWFSFLSGNRRIQR